MRRAQRADMAAIFALIFVPGLAAVLFMVGLVSGGMTLATGFASLVFVALSTGLVAGLFRLAHTWDEEPS
jgi:hypothetical protein